MRDRPIRSFYLMALMSVLVGPAPGCGTSAPRPDDVMEASSELPPAYTRDKIIDPKLADVSRAFTGWVEAQKAGTAPIFSRVEVLPPTPTVLPYGIGANQKEVRLPAILITGAGWSSLKAQERESLAARAFSELAARLTAAKPEPPIRPSLTIQTPQGLELAWINSLEPGEKSLHGEQE
jgi:hypothetical protein